MKQTNLKQGQHAGSTSVDVGLLPFFAKNLKIKSMLDIGCGPGGNVEFARSLGIDAYGIDGDVSSLPDKDYFSAIDYRIGPSELSRRFDLGWCMEFAEHIDEQYVDNFFTDFSLCEIMCFTAAPPGWGGVGHVNEQKTLYWLRQFKARGWRFDLLKTLRFRFISKLTFRGEVRRRKKQFFKNRGLVFINNNI